MIKPIMNENSIIMKDDDFDSTDDKESIKQDIVNYLQEVDENLRRIRAYPDKSFHEQYLGKITFDEETDFFILRKRGKTKYYTLDELLRFIRDFYYMMYDIY